MKFQALLARTTTWRQKHETTATFCTALNQSAAGHFLEKAVADSMALEIAAQTRVLHVEGLQHWTAQPEALPQQVFNRACLLKLLDRLPCFCRFHASRQWAVLTPLQVLQAAFELGMERYDRVPGQGLDAVEFFP